MPADLLKPTEGCLNHTHFCVGNHIHLLCLHSCFLQCLPYQRQYMGLCIASNPSMSSMHSGWLQLIDAQWLAPRPYFHDLFGTTMRMKGSSSTTWHAAPANASNNKLLLQLLPEYGIALQHCRLHVREHCRAAAATRLMVLCCLTWQEACTRWCDVPANAD